MILNNVEKSNRGNFLLPSEYGGADSYSHREYGGRSWRERDSQRGNVERVNRGPHYPASQYEPYPSSNNSYQQQQQQYQQYGRQHDPSDGRSGGGGGRYDNYNRGQGVSDHHASSYNSRDREYNGGNFNRREDERNNRGQYSQQSNNRNSSYNDHYQYQSGFDSSAHNSSYQQQQQQAYGNNYPYHNTSASGGYANTYGGAAAQQQQQQTFSAVGGVGISQTPQLLAQTIGDPSLRQELVRKLQQIIQANPYQGHAYLQSVLSALPGLAAEQQQQFLQLLNSSLGTSYTSK